MKRHDTVLQIIELSDGKWKFDLKSGMNDEELWKLLSHLKFIEAQLKARLKTEVVHMTDAVDFIIDNEKKPTAT